MDTVKIEIYVDQSAAIKAGKKHYGSTVFEIDPAELTVEQRETLSTCETSRIKDENIPRPQHYRYNLPSVSEATVETAKILLDALAKEKIRLAAKEKQEREEKIARALTLPLEDFRYGGDDWKNGDWSFRNYEIQGVEDDPRLAGKIAAAKEEIERLNAEVKSKREESKKIKEDVERAQEEKKRAEELAKRSQIAAWVAEKGTDNQKKRAELGLLPDDEVIDAIREEAFSPLSGQGSPEVYFRRYQKITRQEVPYWCEYDEDAPHAKFGAEDAETATAEQFAALERIQARMPDAKITLRVHRGWCKECETPDGEEGNIERYSLRVAVSVGAFDFAREYAVE